jgi:hypothetical protein
MAVLAGLVLLLAVQGLPEIVGLVVLALAAVGVLVGEVAALVGQGLMVVTLTLLQLVQVAQVVRGLQRAVPVIAGRLALQALQVARVVRVGGEPQQEVLAPLLTHRTPLLGIRVRQLTLQTFWVVAAVLEMRDAV